MLDSIRKTAKRVPIIGPMLRTIYLKLSGEGRVRKIQTGWLAGAKYYQYRWSTPTADLVETNWGDDMPAAFVKEIVGKKRFFDIGANWGFYVLLAHKHRAPGCEVIAFEPHPQSAAELKTQITLNEVDHATVVQAALTNMVGTVEFADTGAAIAQKLAVVNDSHKASKVIQVPATTLDEASRTYGVPDLLKIDVEGAENLVLEGATELLTKHRPVVLIEIHGETCGARFYELMAQYNYRFFTCTGQDVTDRRYEHHLVCRPQ